jgi:hypothetical protein
MLRLRIASPRQKRSAPGTATFAAPTASVSASPSPAIEDGVVQKAHGMKIIQMVKTAAVSPPRDDDGRYSCKRKKQKEHRHFLWLHMAALSSPCTADLVVEVPLSMPGHRLSIVWDRACLSRPVPGDSEQPSPATRVEIRDLFLCRKSPKACQPVRPCNVPPCA